VVARGGNRREHARRRIRQVARQEVGEIMTSGVVSVSEDTPLSRLPRCPSESALNAFRSSGR
jgi:hypothetical protein